MSFDRNDLCPIHQLLLLPFSLAGADQKWATECIINRKEFSVPAYRKFTRTHHLRRLQSSTVCIFFFQAGPGPQLLGVLLRDPELARPRAAFDDAIAGRPRRLRQAVQGARLREE